MRSKAHIKHHAIHPMLVSFPIGFLCGAVGADVLGRVLHRSGWAVAASYLAIAGILSGLAAAVPGIIDYFYAVPPQSSARKRATYHMLVNVSSLLLFAIAVTAKGRSPAPAGIGVIALEIIGAALLTVGGWLGGTLVQRNFISVEHRYANAGKWSEQSVSRADATSETGVRVATSDELKVDQLKLIRLDDGTRIALARTQQGYCAFQDRCTHRGGSLADGVLICGTVQCLWHGSQFDTQTGQIRAGPAKEPIKLHQVREQSGEVRLKL
jgi:uncharacterized membrane protein/nitrite reductase/ring-hydroxylating ferredoxin subunit